MPRLPRKVTIHVTKCHACHAKCKSMSPSTTAATQTAAASTASTGTQARHQSQPNAIRGCCFFPLRKCIFSVAEPFWVAKLGFLCCWFFVLPRPVFFLPPTGFFLPRTVFSCCLQNAFYLLQRCFFAAGCFFCCFEFFPGAADFLLAFFPAAETVFYRCNFFSCCQTCFLRSDVFLLRTCVFRALRGDKKLENVESYIGRSPLVTWIAHGQIGDKGDQTLKQPE